MNFENWFNKYGDITDVQKAQEGIDSFRALMDQKKIYLWGAGSVVRIYIDLFKKVNIPIAGLIDKQSHGECVESFDVLPPSILLTVTDPKNTVVITSVGSTIGASYISADFDAMQTSLPPVVMGYALFCALQNLVCRRDLVGGGDNCHICNKYGSTCTIGAERLNVNKDESLTLDMVSCCLGTVCTLSCKHCSEGIPYVQRNRRGFTSPEVVKNDIKRLTEACDYIVELEFTGGEPLLHPHLREILTFTVSIQNIDHVNVITNGTVIPDDLLCTVLRNPRVKVLISDYTGQISPKLEENIAKTVHKLKEHNISFEQRKHLIWSDMNSFESRGLSEQQMEKAYKSCIFVHCRRLYNGVLFPCVHYFAGVQTGKLTCDPKECLHIYDIPASQLKESLHQYLMRPFVSACDRCMAPFDAPEVPVAQQTENKLTT